MKKLLVLLLSLSIFGCEKNFENTSLNVDVKLKELSTKINKSTYLQGYGTLLSTTNNEIVLGFDETNDGTYENLIIVQSEIEMSIKIPTSKVELVHLKNEALLKISDTGELLYFATPEIKSKSKIIPLLSSQADFPDKNLMLGYGFIVMNGAWKSDQLSADKGFFADESARTQQELCHAGGCGSTECSTFIAGSGCSTSCSEGYYACCQSPLDCHCSKINKKNCPEDPGVGS